MQLKVYLMVCRKYSAKNVSVIEILKNRDDILIG